VQLEFSVDDTPATFFRNHWTGRATLTAGEQTIPLQSPWDPTTHFSFRLRRTWHVDLGTHHVAIEKKRPQILAGFRPHSYTVRVDGQTIAEMSGY
jgi:hypothetical protein